ncbi:MAG: ATP-binding protein [Deltaproteobacteria bacterium]|nr:ATP-binding protein [Deltaproteobacteria bacterium]MBW2342147.1 ATP-binding protein [Deltaproteobacteria bacterium]
MIKRKLFIDLVSHLSQKEISVIIGPRQSGKTTLMEMLREHLDKKGERTLYLNLDIEWDRPHFDSQSALLRKIELELSKQQGYVFIDEIQRKENAGLFLKGLFDLRLPYKFIVSGSGSLELKEKIHESLVGRKRLFELSTITFDEFINHKTDYKYKENLAGFLEVEKDKTQQLLMEYMNFGGYPRVVLSSEQTEKVQIIDEIYRSVLEKDIAYLLKVDKTDAFSALIKILSSQIGNLISYSELSSTLNISYQTVKKYLWYSQKIFLLDLISPYARNVRKEITKSPVPYFWDLGLRNYALGIFGHVGSQSEGGFIFENLVFLLLKEHVKLGTTKVNFWRTRDKAEVDFILESGRKAVPVEVKYKSLRKEEIPRSLRSFIEKYSPDEAYIINLDYKNKLKINKTTLFFLPYYELLYKKLVPKV